MTVKVTERDDSHMSHEGVAAGIRIWDVHQQDMLVGMFHSETCSLKVGVHIRFCGNGG
ncbi:hypothetical protein ACYZTR_08145 [Pseudomonas sp. Hz4]